MRASNHIVFLHHRDTCPGNRFHTNRQHWHRGRTFEDGVRGCKLNYVSIVVRVMRGFVTVFYDKMFPTKFDVRHKYLPATYRFDSSVSRLVFWSVLVGISGAAAPSVDDTLDTAPPGAGVNNDCSSTSILSSDIGSESKKKDLPCYKHFATKLYKSSIKKFVQWNWRENIIASLKCVLPGYFGYA